MRVVTPPRKIYKYKNADYQSTRRELRSTQADYEEKATTEDVVLLWSTFKEKIHTLMESYIPSEILHRNREHKPWISRQVKTHLRKSKKLFQRQRRTGKVRDIRHYKETKARTAIILAVCQQHHRGGRPRPRSTAQAEEILVIH